jgi:phage baseplate assembly protein gpV
MKPAVGFLVALALLGGATLGQAAPRGLYHRTHHTVSGELLAYDPAAHTITLKVKSGTRVFRVAHDAQAWIGADALPLEQLLSRKGARATVTYSEKAGELTTRTIRFTAAAPH